MTDKINLIGKIVSIFLLVVLLLFGSCIFADAHQLSTKVRDIEEKQAPLLEQWFDEEEIKLIPENEIEEYQRAVPIDIEEKYYQINVCNVDTYITSELTKESFEKEVAKLSSMDEFSQIGYVKIKMLVFLLTDGDYKISSNVTWVKKPAKIKRNILSLYTDAGVLQGKSPIYNYSYKEKIYKDGILQNSEMVKQIISNEDISLKRIMPGCELEGCLKRSAIQCTPMINGNEFGEHSLYMSFEITPENNKYMNVYEKLSCYEGDEGISISVTLDRKRGCVVGN